MRIAMTLAAHGQRIDSWRLADFPGSAETNRDAALGIGDGWIETEAPGDVYVALIAAGRLPHPFEERNEAGAAWVRDREWWWHTSITLPEPLDGSSYELTFEGLDTFADILIDGSSIGQADNMFRTWRFDLSGIAPGEHHLAVRFQPSIPAVAGDPVPVWSTFTDRVTRSRRTLMRKAQFGWGWDWGPDLPTVGICGAVWLRQRAESTIRSVNFTTYAIDAAGAHVEVDVDVEGTGDVRVDLLDPAGALVAHGTLARAGKLALTVPDPQIWWTADLGDQPLYTLLTRMDGAAEDRRQVGIRTIAIDQSPDPDEPGTTFFRFVLNGVPVFAKGACWVPASSFVGVVTDATYRDLLERAVGANMNMIRVWGGGIYEPDVFYDTCDRLGLLVWQDFMFACAPYPETEAFLRNVRAEAADQIKRLRHRPCLALWCGNNENQAIQFFEDHATGTATPLEGLMIYDHLLPDVLAALDPHTPYWPGSPWGGPSPNSMRGGDVHNWTVWHGVPPVPDSEAEGVFARDPEGVAYTRYAEDMARFVSEFGLQGAPDIGTLRRWMAPEDLALGSTGLLERIKDEANKADAMMLPVTGLPTTIDQFVDFTMFAQAEGLKFGIEHYRRRKPHCSGALIWQFNDCWPCVSWSLIDHDGVAKASLYAAARAFAPVLASFREVENQVELWITNDGLTPFNDVARVALTHLTNGDLWRTECPFEVPPNSSGCVWRADVDRGNDHALTVHSVGGAFPPNRLLPVSVKDLALAGDPGLTLDAVATNGGMRFTIGAAHYALAVRLRSDNPALRFSDNHFDLSAGERRSINVSNAHGQSVESDAVHVSCLNQSLMAR